MKKRSRLRWLLAARQVWKLFEPRLPIMETPSPGDATSEMVPVLYTSRATEFTIKQKARGNKGDKIFPSENIYGASYFKEATGRSSCRRFLRGKRPAIVHRSLNRLFIAIREAEVRKFCGQAAVKEWINSREPCNLFYIDETPTRTISWQVERMNYCNQLEETPQKYLGSETHLKQSSPFTTKTWFQEKQIIVRSQMTIFQSLSFVRYRSISVITRFSERRANLSIP